MNKESPLTESANHKEQRAKHMCRVIIRDREHFYKIINWMNSNVGKGEDKWTMEGRVLRSLKQGKMPNPKIYIFIEEFDVSSLVYISLL